MKSRYFTQAFSYFLEDKAPRLAASITFYILLALAPLLLIFVHIFALFLGTSAAQTTVNQVITPLLPPSGVEYISTINLSAFSQQASIGVIIISVAIALVTASGAVLAVQYALHTIWGIRPNKGLKSQVHSRIVSVVFIVLISVLLLASMLTTVTVTLIEQWLAAYVTLPTLTVRLSNIAIFLVLITTLFYYTQAALSQVRLPRKALLFSGMITAVLFFAGQIALGYYFDVAFSSSTGIAGAVLVFLLWIYYLVQVFLFGTELAKAYTVVEGITIVPVSGFDVVSAKKHGHVFLTGPQKMWVRATTVVGLIQLGLKAHRAQKKVKKLFKR